MAVSPFDGVNRIRFKGSPEEFRIAECEFRIFKTRFRLQFRIRNSNFAILPGLSAQISLRSRLPRNAIWFSIYRGDSRTVSTSVANQTRSGGADGRETAPRAAGHNRPAVHGLGFPLIPAGVLDRWWAESCECVEYAVDVEVDRCSHRVVTFFLGRRVRARRRAGRLVRGGACGRGSRPMPAGVGVPRAR